MGTSLNERVEKAVDKNSSVADRTMAALQLAEALVETGEKIPDSMSEIVQELQWQLSDIAREIGEVRRERVFPWALISEQEYETLMLEEWDV